jgi:NitT/TauT family transport system permease protein
MSTRLPSAAYPIITLLVAITIWELSVVLFAIPSYLLPPFHKVIATLGLEAPTLAMHSVTTLVEIFLGFALTIAVAIPISIAIAASTLIDKLVYPVLVASQTIPKVAIAPLLLVWLGFGLAPKIAIVVIVAFFPLVIATVAGLKSTPVEMLQLGRSMGLSRRAMFQKVVLPQALPQIFAGVKVAVTLSVIGAVVGEFVGSDSGLGYLLIRALANLDIELMFADLIVLSLIGVVLFNAVSLLEKRAIPWHASQRGTFVAATG